MFPLGMVLLPGAYLPLQVFEPRYRALVQDCLAGEPEFGVVLIERGREVGGGDHRFDVGCVARIVEAGQSPDGRWGLGTVGTTRVRVTEWLEDDPYPRADVAPWPDDLGEPVDTTELWSTVRRVLALAAEVGERVVPAATVEAVDDPTAASYQLASLLPIGPLDRYELLRAPTVESRLRLGAELLADVEVVLATRLDGG
jgi:Lon protease-like protein